MPSDLALESCNHRLLSHEEEIRLGEQFHAARRDLQKLVVGSDAGVQELVLLGGRLKNGELHLALVIDVDAAVARQPDARRTSGQTKHETCERQFLERLRGLRRVQKQLPVGADQASVERHRNRLGRLAQGLHLRDDVLCELARRVKASLPDEETYRAIVDAEIRGNSARDEFVRCNLRFVVALAKRYVGKGLALSDLVQEGNLGLLRAVEKFDPSRGYRFSTYAAWWIRQGMSRALCNQSRTIRVPVHAIDLNRQLTQARHTHELRTGERATTAELAEQVGLDAAKVEAFGTLVSEPLSLDAPLGAGADASLGEFVADDADGPAEVAMHGDLALHLQAMVSKLSRREQMVLRLRFGLDGRGARTLQEIGKAAGVSRERIRQLEVEALRKLRRLAPPSLPDTLD